MGQPGTTEAAAEYDSYIRTYAEERGTPSDRLYLDVHRGHMVFMKPGEERFVSEDAISRTLTGSPSQIMERMEEIEATGVNCMVIQTPNAAAARDLIRDFPREALARG